MYVREPVSLHYAPSVPHRGVHLQKQKKPGVVGPPCVRPHLQDPAGAIELLCARGLKLDSDGQAADITRSAVHRSATRLAAFSCRASTSRRMPDGTLNSHMLITCSHDHYGTTQSPAGQTKQELQASKCDCRLIPCCSNGK